MVSSREVIEACAIALWHSSDDNPPPWERGCPNVKESFRRDVLAVIRALAAQGCCTEAMWRAWVVSDDCDGYEEQATSDLRAMLTALADGYEGGGGV